MRSPFKKKARPCTPQGARFLFLLLLGREPHLDAELEPFLDLSFFGATKRMLLSAIFAQSVVDPFLLGKRPMQVQFSAEQSKFIAGSAKVHFSAKLTEAQSGRWPQCLAACLEMDRAQRAFLKAFSPDRLGYLAEQFAGLKGDAPAIEADVQQTHGTRIQGTIAVKNPNGPLDLDLYLNGVPAGTAVVQQTQANSLKFEHTLRWLDENSPNEAMLTIFERVSGVMICPPKEVILNLAAASTLFARAQAAIEAGEADASASGALANKAWMTSLDRITDLPLDEYDLYRQLYQPPEVRPQADVPSIGICLINHDTQEMEAARASLRAQTFQNYQIFETLGAGQRSSFDLIIALTPGEVLHPRALALIAEASTKFPDADVIRFGYDYLEDGTYHSPVFVAKFDPLIAQQTPSYATAFAARRQVIEKHSEEMPSADFLQNLHAEKGQSAFAFVPEVLLTRPGSCVQEKPQKLRLPEVDGTKKLAIIVPTKDKLSLLKACIESLQKTIEFKATTEIVIVDNNSEDSSTREWLDGAPAAFSDCVKVSIVKDTQPFNWAAINNAAASQQDADLLLFLNNDTQALAKGWDVELRGLLAMPATGVVGAKLLFDDGTVQHAGAILHTDGRIKHEAMGFEDNDAGYQNRLALTRCCDAVTGAFLACSKHHFDEIGGFDQSRFAVTYNDIDFCLSTTAMGRQIIYAADIKFLHLESQSRGSDSDPQNRGRELRERENLLKKWAPAQLMDAWLPIQLAYDPGKQNLILKRVRKTLETIVEKRQKSRQ
ncbi:MAG: glycosyltransferase [Kordiimonadaceae bacterium]|nr:glycosyltransferase [Kordiimonadaceae bacterium]MBO6569481.1 glycosyltransferase [Kordiimonadaceae bacterium]MBO6964956.1 glycosyltransferase [Kordiimonadaceae bacterium]